MKTSVELDEKKVIFAKKISHTSTLRELLDKALDAYINQARRQNMIDLLGSNFFDSKLAKMRGKNGRTR